MRNTREWLERIGLAVASASMSVALAAQEPGRDEVAREQAETPAQEQAEGPAQEEGAREAARAREEAQEEAAREAARAREEAQEQAAREATRARERAREEALYAQEQAERTRNEAVRAREQAREREQEQRESEERSHRAALERARAELEAAAREVADLSARLSAPAMAEAGRRIRSVTHRATLGVVLDNASEDARVLSVTPGGPAAEAGIESGDVIVAIAGERVVGRDDTTPTQLVTDRVANAEPGEPLELAVERDGDELTLIVTPDLGELRNPFVDMRLPDVDVRLPDRNNLFPQFRALRAFNAWQSMQLVELTPELGSYFGTEQGLLVVRGPDREELELRDGDVILEIGGREPSSPEHAMRILASFEPGETLSLTIMRERRREQIELEVPDPEGL